MCTLYVKGTGDTGCGQLVKKGSIHAIDDNNATRNCREVERPELSVTITMQS